MGSKHNKNKTKKIQKKIQKINKTTRNKTIQTLKKLVNTVKHALCCCTGVHAAIRRGFFRYPPRRDPSRSCRGTHHTRPLLPGSPRLGIVRRLADSALRLPHRRHRHRPFRQELARPPVLPPIWPASRRHDRGRSRVHVQRVVQTKLRLGVPTRRFSGRVPR